MTRNVSSILCFTGVLLFFLALTAVPMEQTHHPRRSGCVAAACSPGRNVVA